MENITLIYCSALAIAVVACFIVSACSKVKMMAKADKKYIIDIDTVKVCRKDDVEE